MTDPEIAELVRRVERLERLVEGLTAPARVHAPEPPPPPATPPTPVRESEPAGIPETPVDVGPTVPTSGTRRSTLSGERFLARVGIGFVILALAFLLKLSFDRGWITPTLRLAAGFVAGALLHTVGLRLERSRRRLAQVLLGGAVAVFYLVGYAGFQLYGLLPFWPALALMTATTFLSYVLSDRQDAPALALIGVAGGLATPFLLETGSDDPGSLALYTSVVVLGAGAVQLHRGWLSLLAVVAVGGGLVVSAMASAPGAGAPLVVSGGILAYWVVTALSPLARPLGERSPPAPGGRGFQRRAVFTRLAWGFGTTVALAGVASAWDVGRVEVGVVALVVAAATGLIAYGGRRVALTARPAGDLAALTAGAGLVLVAGGSTGLLLLVAEAGLLFELTRRGAPSSLTKVGHVLTLAACVAFAPVAASGEPGGLVFTEGAWARLAMLAALAVVSLQLPRDAAALYRLAAHVGLLVWSAFELRGFSHGLALISIAWAVQGGLVLLGSMVRDSRGAKVLGLLTLGLVAGKLLVMDLAALDPVWRIFLFLGFGAALLGLSYLVGRPGQAPSVGDVRSSD